MQHSSGCHTSLRRSTLERLTWDGVRVDTMAAKRRADQEPSRWEADNTKPEMQTVVFIILVGVSASAVGLVSKSETINCVGHVPVVLQSSNFPLCVLGEWVGCHGWCDVKGEVRHRG
jgi:hypothetical protein